MRATLNGTEIFFDIDSGALRASHGTLLRKPTLIVLHGGLGFDHGYLRPGMDVLRNRVQIVYVDLRGQGRSGRPSLDTCTLEQMADDVAALCAHLGIDRSFVLGHSAGGFVAMHLALRHPALVEGLILCGSSPTVRPIADDPGDPAPSLASRATPEVLAIAARVFSGDITDESIAAFFRDVVAYYAGPAHMDLPAKLMRLSTMDIGMMRHFMTAIAPTYDLRPRLGEIAAPTLVMVGKYDWVCPPRASRAIAAGIAGATLVEFEDAGHFVFSEDPQRFLGVSTGFIAAAGQRSS